MAYEKRPRLEAAIVAHHARKHGLDVPNNDPPKDGKVRCEYVLTGNPGDDNQVISRYKRAGYDVDEKSKTSYSVTFVAPVERVRQNAKEAEALHYKRVRQSAQIADDDKSILASTLLEGIDLPPSPEDFLKP